MSSKPLCLLLVTAVAADAAVGAASGVPRLALALVFAFLLVQCGRTYVRLSNAPVYPRASYYGVADIAPELPGAEDSARRASLIGGVVAAGAAVLAGAATALAGVGVPAGSFALAAGIAIPTTRAARLEPARFEESLRERYVLYLRSFSSARSWVVLAVAIAAAPWRVVAVLSPRRTEVRSLSWYLFGALFPVQFGRMEFWTTSSNQWGRVVASCMNSARGMVVDYTALPAEIVPDRGAPGLEIEAGMSFGFAAGRPTAYLIEPHRPMPIRVPVPSQLQISGSPVWIARRFPALVGRLRAVLERRLSADELAYLDQYYARHREDWEAAMVRDRNRAAREGRPNPSEILHSRDPLAELERRRGQRDSSALSQSAGRNRGTDPG